MNCLGVRNLARACSRTGSWLIHISTDYVYSENADYRECPKCAYGFHKWAGEIMARAETYNLTVLRVGCLYGMNRSKSFIHKFLGNAVKSNFSPDVVDCQSSVPTSTLFVCEAI